MYETFSLKDLDELYVRVENWPRVTAFIHEWASDNPTDVTERMKTPDGPDVLPPFSSWADFEAFWNLDRNGMSMTLLPDGRKVFIGGEHEDYYDPNFCIYNDVIVVHPNTNEVTVYAYTREVFPPTDFHMAILHGNDIWVIGSIGYMPGTNKNSNSPIQVLRLDTTTFAMELVQPADRNDGPGWMSFTDNYELADKVRLDGDRIYIVDDHGVNWAFEVNDRVWSRV